VEPGVCESPSDVDAVLLSEPGRELSDPGKPPDELLEELLELGIEGNPEDDDEDELGIEGIDEDDDEEELGIDGIDDDEDEDDGLGGAGIDEGDDGDELGMEGMPDDELLALSVDSQPASTRASAEAPNKARTDEIGLRGVFMWPL
jgi:hypothetical protein